MPRLELSYGMDLQGDACVYIQVIDDQGEPIRYCNEDELRALFADHVYDDHEIPEGMGICLTCGGSVSDWGTCSNACPGCDEHFVGGVCPTACVSCGIHWEGADGSLRYCPECADKRFGSEEDEDVNPEPNKAGPQAVND